jgi:hypothetical protein
MRKQLNKLQFINLKKRQNLLYNEKTQEYNLEFYLQIGALTSLIYEKSLP